MICPYCKTTNDSDALFCVECGTSLADQSRQAMQNRRRPYWFALLLIPVVMIAVAIGYYKFYLPQGIAAVVNGEEITLSELDAALVRIPGSDGQLRDRMRYEVLDELITERLLLQEAEKAGITVERDALKAAVAAARVSSGLDDAAFTKSISDQYGSARAFENDLARRLRIKKFLDEKIAPRGVDPRVARLAVDRWYQAVSQRASVRIALVSQGGFGCGGCTGEAGQASPCGGRTGINNPAGSDSSLKTAKAAKAGLAYWQAKHGADQVAAKVRDFGCHMQIDIVKDEKIIGSLRYQGGVISEW
jgi:SurA-like N-terminal domain